MIVISHSCILHKMESGEPALEEVCKKGVTIENVREDIYLLKVQITQWLFTAHSSLNHIPPKKTLSFTQWLTVCNHPRTCTLQNKSVLNAISLCYFKLKKNAKLLLNSGAIQMDRFQGKQWVLSNSETKESTVGHRKLLGTGNFVLNHSMPQLPH